MKKIIKAIILGLPLAFTGCLVNEKSTSSQQELNKSSNLLVQQNCISTQWVCKDTIQVGDSTLFTNCSWDTVFAVPTDTLGNCFQPKDTLLPPPDTLAWPGNGTCTSIQWNCKDTIQHGDSIGVTNCSWDTVLIVPKDTSECIPPKEDVDSTPETIPPGENFKIEILSKYDPKTNSIPAGDTVALRLYYKHKLRLPARLIWTVEKDPSSLLKGFESEQMVFSRIGSEFKGYVLPKLKKGQKTFVEVKVSLVGPRGKTISKNYKVNVVKRLKKK